VEQRGRGGYPAHEDAERELLQSRRGATLKSMDFKAVFEEEADGGFSVYVPDLPGCASQGDTFQEAVRNIHEAVEGYLEGLRMDGLPIPKPRARIETVTVKAA
jgi:predicted RNase H-like HicB family nuclease